MIRENVTPLAKIFDHEVSDLDRMYVRHGQQQSALDLYEPVDLGFSESMMLGPHVDQTHRMISVRFERLDSNWLTGEARKSRRPLMEAVYEWARLHPHQIPKMFDVFRSDEDFRVNFRKYYEGLRLIARRTTNIEPEPVKECEEFVTRKLEETIAWQKEKIQKMEEDLARMKKDAEELTEIKENGLASNRVAIRNRVRAVQYEQEDPDPSGFRPFTYAKQRDSIRGRSISRSRARKRSRSRSLSKRSKDGGYRKKIIRGVPMEVRANAHSRKEEVFLVREKDHEVSRKGKGKGKNSDPSMRVSRKVKEVSQDPEQSFDHEEDDDSAPEVPPL